MREDTHECRATHLRRLSRVPLRPHLREPVWIHSRGRAFESDRPNTRSKQPHPVRLVREAHEHTDTPHSAGRCGPPHPLPTSAPLLGANPTAPNHGGPHPPHGSASTCRTDRLMPEIGRSNPRRTTRAVSLGETLAPQPHARALPPPHVHDQFGDDRLWAVGAKRRGACVHDPRRRPAAPNPDRWGEGRATSDAPPPGLEGRCCKGAGPLSGVLPQCPPHSQQPPKTPVEGCRLGAGRGCLDPA